MPKDKNKKTVQIDLEQHERLVELKDRYGRPIAESVRRALDDYLREEGLDETDPPRRDTG